MNAVYKLDEALTIINNPYTKVDATSLLRIKEAKV